MPTDTAARQVRQRPLSLPTRVLLAAHALAGLGLLVLGAYLVLTVVTLDDSTGEDNSLAGLALVVGGAYLVVGLALLVPAVAAWRASQVVAAGVLALVTGLAGTGTATLGAILLVDFPILATLGYVVPVALVVLAVAALTARRS